MLFKNWRKHAIKYMIINRKHYILVKIINFTSTHVQKKRYFTSNTPNRTNYVCHKANWILYELGTLYKTYSKVNVKILFKTRLFEQSQTPKHMKLQQKEFFDLLNCHQTVTFNLTQTDWQIRVLSTLARPLDFKLTWIVIASSQFD